MAPAPPAVSALGRLTLAGQFLLATLAILLAGMLIIGWWVGNQIEATVVSRTAAATALYVDSFVAPHLQSLASRTSLAAAEQGVLVRLLQDTPLGRKIVAFKVWDSRGRILFSTDRTALGRQYDITGGLARALAGDVSARVSDLRAPENVSERPRWSRLIEIYIPVRSIGTDRVVAVAEFYQEPDELLREIGGARARSWLLVGAATLAMYVLLAGLAKRGSDTIARQQAELRLQVERLTKLLAANARLHEQVRGAAMRSTALNERFLRRIGAELHDGPAQYLALALLRLDAVTAHCYACGAAAAGPQAEFGTIRGALRRALDDLRAIAAGLRLPELDDLTLGETIARVVRSHEKLTAGKVRLQAGHLPDQTGLPVKITLYRLVQEALSNAYRHGGGADQAVAIERENGGLRVRVSDSGPGFDPAGAASRGTCLGLASMRERVTSLGGTFRLDTGPGRGTLVEALLPLDAEILGDGTQ